jgi:hypothetical protein
MPENPISDCAACGLKSLRREFPALRKNRQAFTGETSISPLDRTRPTKPQLSPAI